MNTFSVFLLASILAIIAWQLYEIALVLRTIANHLCGINNAHWRDEDPLRNAIWQIVYAIRANREKDVDASR